MGLIKDLLSNVRLKFAYLTDTLKDNYYAFYNNIKTISLHKKLSIMNDVYDNELSPISPTEMTVTFEEISSIDVNLGRWIKQLAVSLATDKPKLIIEQNESNNALINIKLVFRNKSTSDIILISRYGTSLYPYIEKEEILQYLINQNKYNTELSHACD